jgi:glycosyltransferase involved in cell wall biosynthesis
MDKIQLYFWEPTVSPPKIALFNELSKHSSVEATWYIAQEELSAERRREGWSIANFSSKNLIIAPERHRVRQIMASSSPQAIHLFSGAHWVSCIVDGIEAAIETGRHFGLMREPRASEGVKGWARFVHSWLTEGRVRRRADFVLAIGRNGPPWFRAVGYAEEKIFPFAYFLPAISGRGRQLEKLLDRGQRRVKVCFLGRIEKSKGICLFLDAVEKVMNAITVDIAGTGREADLVRQAAVRSRVPLTYHGPIPMKTVPDFLGHTDILVLPSITNDDGWGAVVSEALLAGAAVVVTDRVGASICVGSDTRGTVVNRLSGRSIAAAIDWLIDNERLTADYRARRSAWAHSRLTGRAGADYLLAIFAHLYVGKIRPEPFYDG